MIGIGIVGYGYWGPNLARNFVDVPDANIVSISDLSPKRLEQVNRRYPSVETTSRFSDLLSDPRIDAIAIATPVSTHFELAMQALRAGKHVLVEKPLTTSSEQACRLIEEAAHRNLVLMVDHTFVYTGAVRKIKELVTSQKLGDILYYDSARINLGLFQHDVNVLWDLAVHDLSIMDYVLPSQPRAVCATGINHISGEPANIAYLTLFFDGSLIAHIHANWLSPVKVRRTLIGGSRNMIVYDDLEPSEKIKVYDRGIAINNHDENLYQMLIGYRTGDMWSPQLDTTEALRAEAQHFVRCIEGSERPITDGETGLRVVEILEAATQSMARRGRLIELSSESSERLPYDSLRRLEVAVP